MSINLTRSTVTSPFATSAIFAHQLSACACCWKRLFGTLFGLLSMRSYASPTAMFRSPARLAASVRVPSTTSRDSGRENSQQQKLKLSDPMTNHWLGQPLFRTFCVRFKGRSSVYAGSQPFNVSSSRSHYFAWKPHKH